MTQSPLALAPEVLLGVVLAEAADALAVSETGDTVPRSRYDACNTDWLTAKADADKLNKIITRLIASIQKNAPPLLAVTIINDAKEPPMEANRQGADK